MRPVAASRVFQGAQETERRVTCRLLGIANDLDGMGRERAAGQAGMDH